MDSEIVIVNDAKVQSLGLKISFSTEGDKLIIEAYSSKDNQKYVGEMIANPYVDLEAIKELLNEGQFKTLLKNEEILKIKAGPVPIELLPKEKSEIKELKEALSKSVDKQVQMQAIIDLQNAQLNKHENMIKDLKTTVEELKSSPKVTTLTIEEIKGEFSQKIKELEENRKTEISSIKNEQQEFLSSSEAERKMEAFSVELREIKDEVKKINDYGENERVNIDEFKREVKESTDNLKREIADFEKITKNQSIVIDQLKKSLEDKIQENKMIIGDHEKRLTITEKLANHETSIRATEKTVFEQGEELKEHENKINETLITVSQQSEELKELEMKLKLLIPELERKLDQPVEKLEFSLVYSRLNEPIRSSKWSESKGITINNNVITLTNYTRYREFCLLNTSFSNKIKTKQSWAIKINKKIKWIYLGVCLKSKIIKYNFNGENISWWNTGHGLYMIGSDGGCLSHSEKEFNDVSKSFKFDENDVIYVEYDPINLKLRFSKNKIDKFELSIIVPQENDAYHPFVLLPNENDSVELLPTEQVN